MTYRIHTVAGRPAIECLLCGRISELAGDVAHTYCSRCKLFHDVVAEGRRLLAAGGTHECDEWKTYRDMCALCGHALGPRAGLEEALAIYRRLSVDDLRLFRAALVLDRQNGAAPGFCDDRILAIDRELAGRRRPG